MLSGGECLCISTTTDVGIFAWAFEWWPHALLHGINPLFSHLIYAPYGMNIAQGQLIPAVSLLFAPVTAIVGPLSAFNLAMLLSPVLGAFFAFLLCRRLTGAFWPALVGGWLFGFSTYMLGQLTSHLNLTLVFLVPAIVHLVLRLIAGELTPRRFTVLMTPALLMQFGFSPEVFVSFTLFGAVAGAVAYGLGPEPLRRRLVVAAGFVALAYAITAMLAAPYLYYAFKQGGLGVLEWRTDKFSNDLLAFVMPDQITQLGGGSFMSTTRGFSAGFVEGGAYLGLPLMLMAALGARRLWNQAGVRLLTIMLAALAVLSLGGQLHVAGSKSIPLPWALVHGLPVLGQMLPARFALYVALCVSVLAALWLGAAGRRPAPWLLALVTVATLWPAVGGHYWRSHPMVPRLFETSAYRREIRPRDTVFLPPVGIAGQSMLWQAEAGLHFTMAGGYVVPPEASDPYKRFAIYPTLTYGAVVPDQQRVAAQFLAATHVTVAVLDERVVPFSPWVPVLERLGWQGRTIAGALILRPAGPIDVPAARRDARRVALRYFRSFAAGHVGSFCATLTPEAIARLVHHSGASGAECVRTLRRVIAASASLRGLSRTARIRTVLITGTRGEVAVHLRDGRDQHLPVRRVGRTWLVDGNLGR